ncbi:putative nuclease HARBI1 isoform X2 [Tanacetum coccineum]
MANTTRSSRKCTVATDPKHTYFKHRQESARKDAERAFGVLQGRWGLIQQPARAYKVNTLRRIMYAGIIMHNMILEDQNMSVVDLKHVYSNPARSVQTVWIDRCETQRNPFALDDKFDSLFEYASGQGSGGQQSEPVNDEPVEEVVPVKRKYTKRRQQSKKNDKDSNENGAPRKR